MNKRRKYVTKPGKPKLLSAAIIGVMHAEATEAQEIRAVQQASKDVKQTVAKMRELRETMNLGNAPMNRAMQPDENK